MEKRLYYLNLSHVKGEIMDKIKETLLSEQDIKTRVKEIAQKLAPQFEGKNALFLSVLNGSFIFCADLLREIPYPVELNFIKVSSYGNRTESTGRITISEHSLDIKDRDLVIIEDIIDSGNTLEQLTAYFKNLGAKSITTVVLLDKKERRTANYEPEIIGFEIEDKFVVGYGLDYAQQYRNLPYIAVLDETKL